MAESEVITERPSSADSASTTSICRPCNSVTSARAARPSAVALPSSSSTMRARREMRLTLRVIIGRSPLLLARLSAARQGAGVTQPKKLREPSSSPPKYLLYSVSNSADE